MKANPNAVPPPGPYGQAARADDAGPGLRRRMWRDRLAVTLSVACAFHCVATPLLILLLPGLRTVFPENPWFEITLLAFVLALGGSSVLHGYRHHRRVLPPVLFAGAFLVLCVQAVLPERDGAWLVPSLTALGLVVALLWSRVPERAGLRTSTGRTSTPGSGPAHSSSRNDGQFS